MITFHFYLCIIVLKLFEIHIYERTAITVMLWYATWELLCNFLFNKVTMKAMCDPPMFYVIVLSLYIVLSAIFDFSNKICNVADFTCI